MIRLIEKIDAFNALLAKGAKWCALAMMVFQALSVILRYVFSVGSIAMQEAVIYGHAILFLFGAAFILQMDNHVRVEIFYSKFSPTIKYKLDMIAQIIFVLPMAVTLLYFSTPYAMSAWQNLEGSRQSGGLPLIFLLKTCILVFAFSLAAQAISIALKLFIEKRAD